MSSLVEAMELKKEFNGFLEGVQLGLGDVFTEVLWHNNIRSAGVLAAAEPDDLVLHGIDKAVARAIIKKAKDVAAPGAQFQQRDMHRLASLGMLGCSPTDKMIYAHLDVTNDRVDPERSCKADVMLDSGCSMEIVLPARKAVQLNLQKMDARKARSFGDHEVSMTIFAHVLVKIVLMDKDGNVTEKMAMLEPSSQTDKYDQELRCTTMPKLSWEEYPKIGSDGMLEVSPIKRKSNAAVLDCLLGIEGMRKLKLTVDFEQSIIMPMMVEDMQELILATGSELGSL